MSFGNGRIGCSVETDGEYIDIIFLEQAGVFSDVPIWLFGIATRQARFSTI